MVNYQSADSAGAAYYQVLVDGAVQTDSWTVFHWNGTAECSRSPSSPRLSGPQVDRLLPGAP